MLAFTDAAATSTSAQGKYSNFLLMFWLTLGRVDAAVTPPQSLSIGHKEKPMGEFLCRCQRGCCCILQTRLSDETFLGIQRGESSEPQCVELCQSRFGLALRPPMLWRFVLRSRLWYWLVQILRSPRCILLGVLVFAMKRLFTSWRAN